MNKKGYTLIEIIGAVIILGIIAIIAVATFTRNLRGFRDDYYAQEENSLKEAGREFFSDNRNLRPNELLEGQKVTLEILESRKYINEVVDYNGDKCDGYVLSVKENKNDFSYHACLSCPLDNYNSKENDKYCDDTINWELESNIEHDIGDQDVIYIYKGTTREKLKELLYINIEYIRKKSTGEEIIKSSDEDSKKVLPQDIDKVDVETLGEYEVTYEYEGKVVKRKVIIYENDAPIVTLEKEDVITTNLKGDTTVDKVNYNLDNWPSDWNNAWTQKINLTFSYNNKFIDEGSNVSGYQWYKDGRWQDICKPQNCFSGTDIKCECKVSYDKEMKEEIRFRSVDSHGNISKETKIIKLGIDNTKPTCNLKVASGTKKDNDWYVDNVVININSYKDNATTEGTVSGLKIHNLLLETDKIPTSNGVDNRTQTTDTKAITYVGYVEDYARNSGLCPISFKRDATKPRCELKIAGTNYEGKNNVFLTDVNVSFSKTIEEMSGIKEYGINSLTGNKEIVHSKNGNASYKGYIKDNAGNENNCSTIEFTKNPDLEVIFNVNGGGAWNKSNCGNGFNLTQGICHKKVQYNKDYSSLPTPVKTGYTFTGWYTSSSNGNKISSNTKVTLKKDHYLYAHWTPNKFTIKFNGNGANGGAMNDLVCMYDQNCIIPANKFTRSDHNFIGWATTFNGGVSYANGANIKNKYTGGTIILYAKWNYNPPPAPSRDDDDDHRGNNRGGGSSKPRDNGGGGGSSSGGGGGRRGGGNGCFLAGTKVMTIKGYKNIEDIEVGDIVLSYNIETNKNEFKKVTYKYILKNNEHDLYEFTIDNKKLKVTDEHVIYIKRNGKNILVAAKDIKLGDMMVYYDGTYHEITEINYIHEIRTVYNIEVKDNHNYYVTNDMILVHNDCDDPRF